MQRWKPSGARLNARPWKEANNGPRIAFDGSYSNSSKRPITGAGSTALWGINHLWTSNKTTTKNGKDRVKYCDHKKGGRESAQMFPMLAQSGCRSGSSSAPCRRSLVKANARSNNTLVSLKTPKLGAHQ